MLHTKQEARGKLVAVAVVVEIGSIPYEKLGELDLAESYLKRAKELGYIEEQ